MTWGDPCLGGDCTDVQDQLQNVQQVQASYHAFAAVRGDGSVLTWGSPHDVGDSRGVHQCASKSTHSYGLRLQARSYACCILNA